MVSVLTALSIISRHAEVLKPKKLSLEDSLGHFLAEDMYAPISMPPFRQSEWMDMQLSMDRLILTNISCG